MNNSRHEKVINAAISSIEYLRSSQLPTRDPVKTPSAVARVGPTSQGPAKSAKPESRGFNDLHHAPEKEHPVRDLASLSDERLDVANAWNISGTLAATRADASFRFSS